MIFKSIKLVKLLLNPKKGIIRKKLFYLKELIGSRHFFVTINLL